MPAAGALPLVKHAYCLSTPHCTRHCTQLLFTRMMRGSTAAADAAALAWQSEAAAGGGALAAARGEAAAALDTEREKLMQALIQGTGIMRCVGFVCGSFALCVSVCACVVWCLYGACVESEAAAVILF